MVDDAVGEVVGGVVEVAVEALADIGSSSLEPKRRRKGCWRLFLIILALAVIVGIVIALST